MLVSFPKETEKKQLLEIKKTVGTKDVSSVCAFSSEEKINLCFTVSRRVAATAVFVEFCDDNTSQNFEKKCVFDDIHCGCDVYNLKIDLKQLCPDGDNLLFWRVRSESGKKTLYTHSVNNVDFELWENADTKKFRLLVYDKEYSTPDWAKKSVMYQIFVDRFNKGSKKIKLL